MQCKTKEDFFKKLTRNAKYGTFIMRGLPGSGKSTFLKEINERLCPGSEPTVASADDYFMVDGEYRYDITKRAEAHDWCMKKFVDNFKGHCGPYFVDNTNTTFSEINRYIIPARNYCSFIYIITLHVDVATSIARNVHKVPANVIVAMQSRLIKSDKELDYVIRSAGINIGLKRFELTTF